MYETQMQTSVRIEPTDQTVGMRPVSVKTRRYSPGSAAMGVPDLVCGLASGSNPKPLLRLVSV